MTISLPLKGILLVVPLLCSLQGDTQATKEDDRWVWRRARSPNTDSFNPFEPFSSDSVETEPVSISQFSTNQQFSSPVVFPSESARDVSTVNQRGSANILNNQPAIPNFPDTNEFFASPIDTTFSRGFSENTFGDNSQRSLRQQSLAQAHFTIPSQLGRPVSITTPTSNHLPPVESEVLVSSYSSLDAKAPNIEQILEELENSGKFPFGRALLNRNIRNNQRNGNELEAIQIKPLPIDISTLPLESTERAEGIRKLWTTFTSESEFAKLFNSLAATSVRNNRTRSHASIISAESIERDTSSSLFNENHTSNSAIQVITPPELSLQQRKLNQPFPQRQTTQQQQQHQLQLHQQQPQIQLLQQQALQQLTQQSQQPQIQLTLEQERDIQRQKHLQLVERLEQQKRVRHVEERQRQQHQLLQSQLQSQNFNTRRPTSQVSSQISPSITPRNRNGRPELPTSTNFFSLNGGELSQERSSQSSDDDFRNSHPNPSSNPSGHSFLSSQVHQESLPSTGGGSNLRQQVPNAGSSVITDATLVQSTVQLPHLSNSFVVRKLRLSGNYIANVVYIPISSSHPSNSENNKEDILQSASALRFFQKADVQQSIKEFNNQDALIFVEEVKVDGEKTYILTTVEGDRIYPKLSGIQKRDENVDIDGDVWQAFVDIFGNSRARQLISGSGQESILSLAKGNIDGIQGSNFNDSSETPTVTFFQNSNVPGSSPTRLSLAVHSFKKSPEFPGASAFASSRTSRNHPGFSSRSDTVFSSRDEFDPDDFNPFVPFAESDDTTSKRSISQPSTPDNQVPAKSQSPNFDEFYVPESLFKPDFGITKKDAELKSRAVNKQTKKTGKEFAFSEKFFIEPRGDLRSSSKWPWPEDVPTNLDEFFISKNNLKER